MLVILILGMDGVKVIVPKLTGTTIKTIQIAVTIGELLHVIIPNENRR